MLNFTFYNPSRLYFGKGAEENLGALVDQWSQKKILVLYSGSY